MKIKNLRIKQLIKVANLMNRYPAMHEAERDITCRIIAAMVAEAGGFKSRNEWTAEIKGESAT